MLLPSFASVDGFDDTPVFVTQPRPFHILYFILRVVVVLFTG